MTRDLRDTCMVTLKSSDKTRFFFIKNNKFKYLVLNKTCHNFQIYMTITLGNTSLMHFEHTFRFFVIPLTFNFQWCVTFMIQKAPNSIML